MKTGCAGNCTVDREVQHPEQCAPFAFNLLPQTPLIMVYVTTIFLKHCREFTPKTVEDFMRPPNPLAPKPTASSLFPNAGGGLQRPAHHRSAPLGSRGLRKKSRNMRKSFSWCPFGERQSTAATAGNNVASTPSVSSTEGFRGMRNFRAGWHRCHLGVHRALIGSARSGRPHDSTMRAHRCAQARDPSANWNRAPE